MKTLHALALAAALVPAAHAGDAWQQRATDHYQANKAKAWQDASARLGECNRLTDWQAGGSDLYAANQPAHWRRSTMAFDLPGEDTQP